MTVATWPFKLLREDVHSRLVADADNIARIANIPVEMLDRSMASCGSSQTEIEWVRDYRAGLHGDKPGGLIFVGPFNPPPIVRLQSIAAAFLRNYLDARVVSIFDLLPGDAESDIDPTVLLIHDFCRVSVTGGSALTNWQTQYLCSVVINRFSARRSTVLHVDSMDEVRKAYGQSLHDLFKAHWKIIAEQ
jgi:hypothetical protein